MFLEWKKTYPAFTSLALPVPLAIPDTDLRKLYRRAKALSPQKYDFGACFDDLLDDMIRTDPYAYTNTSILRGYALLYRERGL